MQWTRTMMVRACLHSNDTALLLTKEQKWTLSAFAHNTGKVDLFEFVKFILGSMQKVDMETMDKLRDLFRRLDKSGSNFIQKEDLISVARMRDGDDVRS